MGIHTDKRPKLEEEAAAARILKMKLRCGNSKQAPITSEPGGKRPYRDAT